MKKIYTVLFFCAAMLLNFSAAAQLVSAYGFTQFRGTYTSVSGGTVFGSPANNEEFFTDPANPAGGTVNTGPGLPIGFSFVYNNVTYDRFGINTNGWIAFGQSTLTPNAVNLNSSNNFNAISATSTAPADLQCRVVAMGINLFSGPGGELRAQTLGTAPTRTLVVQWSNYNRFFDDRQKFDFQIRLLEGSNRIQVIYGKLMVGTALSAQVGLRGQANTNFNNRTVAITGSWAASAMGTTNAQLCNFNNSVAPARGQVYEWGPIMPCTGAPLASAAAATATNACPGTEVTLTSDYTYFFTSGLSFQWQGSSTGIGGSYANVTAGAGSGTAAVITTTPAGNTAYRAVITCTNSSTSITTTPVQLNVNQPAAAAAITGNSLVCPGSGAPLSLVSPNSGVSYQWQSSTAAGGPFSAIANATLSTFAAANITATTYYQAVISCSATPAASITSAPVTVSVAPAIISNAPYLETFEGITDNYQLPNCQWLDSYSQALAVPGPSYFTYISPGATGQQNHTPGGSKYVSAMYYAENSALFSNGIFLNAGVNYRGSVWYVTDGAAIWFNLSIGISSIQAVAGINNIASVSFPVNTNYKSLSGMFTVPVSGVYYLSVSAYGDQNPNFMSFDDLAIDIPCDQNPVNFSVSAPAAVCVGSTATLSASGNGSILGATSYTWNTGVVGSSVNVMMSSPATYTVTGSNTLGCSDEKIVSVNVTPLPVLSVLATPTAVCSGEMVSLAALGGANTYTWNNGDNNATTTDSPTITTAYTLNGTDVNGCSGSATKIITVNDLPVISAVASPTSICLGESANLQATGGGSYLWTSTAILLAGQSVMTSPNTTTTYSVTGTDDNNCSGTAVVQLKVSACTGLEQLSASAAALAVYPNPTSGALTVELNNTLNKQVAITDLTGRVLMSLETGSSTVNLDLSPLANGIYYVQVRSGNGVNTLKIVKQ